MDTNEREGVSPEIESTVAPTETNPPASPPLPTAESVDTAEVVKLNAEIERLRKQFDELRSVKDSETAAERRARQEMEQRLQATYAELEGERTRSWELWQKQADPEEVERAKQHYAQQHQQQTQYQAQLNAWNAWKYQQALEHGLTRQQVDAIRSNEQMVALIEQKKAEKQMATKEQEIEQRILERLKLQGVVPAPQGVAAQKPKTPLDASAAPVGTSKVTAEDVRKAEWALERARGDKSKAKARAEFVKVSEAYAEQTKD